MNKLKLDFVTLKQDLNSLEVLLTLKNNLVSIIKSFANNDRPKFIIRALCLGLMYVIMQTHNIPQLWSNSGSSDPRLVI
jgi:hypothetical protein